MSAPSSDSDFEITVVPRAPDLETVLDIEGALEPAIKALLEAADVELVAARRGVEILTSRRVDVELTLGAATGNLYSPRNLPDGPVQTGYCLERAWQAQLALRVITERDKNDAFHAVYRARVRALMLCYATLFTPAVLPFHALSDVRSAGTRCGLITQKNEDYSELIYSCLISVRNTAWPDPL